MKRILSSLIFAMALLVNEEAFSSDYFDIDFVSDRIALRLWRGSEVSRDDIEELFKLVEEDQDSKHTGNSNKEERLKEIAELDKYISSWKKIMLIRSQNNDSDDSFKNIDDFVEEVNKLKIEFSCETIKDCLDIVANKY